MPEAPYKHGASHLVAVSSEHSALWSSAGGTYPQLSSPSSCPSSTYQPETHHATSQGLLDPVSSRKGELSEVLSWQSQVGFFPAPVV